MKKKLVASVVTIVMLISLMVSATFALFTSSVNLGGNHVKAGRVDLKAELQFVDAGSSLDPVDKAHKKIKDNKDNNIVVGKMLDYEREVSVVNKSRIEMNNILPGDKGEFKLVFTNNSSVATSYKVLVIPTTDTGLYSALEITGIKFTQEGSINSVAWEKNLAVGKNPDSQNITIEFPASAGNGYQGASFGFDILVYAVQNNGTDGVVIANTLKNSGRRARRQLCNARKGYHS